MTEYYSHFLLNKDKDNDIDARLRYRVKWDKNILAFDIGFRVEFQKWSYEAQRCKANTTHSKKKVPANIINRKIQQYELALQNTIDIFEAKQIKPNKDEFKEIFYKNIGKTPNKNSQNDNLFYYFDLFIKEESHLKQWSKSTIIGFVSLKNKLLDFDPDLNFDCLTNEKLADYINYLQEELKYKNSTIHKNISWLKWFLKWSLKNKYNTNKDFEFFTPKLKATQKNIIFLTPSEFKLFREYNIPENKKYLEQVRDIFLFQCFTGLRYSDVLNMKKTDIKDTFIEVTTIKTNDSLKIELNAHSKRILEKYRNYKNTAKEVFPAVGNNKMNIHIRELAELAGINEPVRDTYYIGSKRYDRVYPKYMLLSTHAGRRTFICNALSLGIPPQVVMKWTGHNDYNSMKPYIDIADEVKRSSMSRFDNL